MATAELTTPMPTDRRYDVLERRYNTLREHLDHVGDALAGLELLLKHDDPALALGCCRVIAGYLCETLDDFPLLDQDSQGGKA